MRCGDCGTETLVAGWYRVCAYCGTRTKMIRRRRAGAATIPLPKMVVDREEEPDQVALCEQHHQDLGQCPHCLHPECKCA